MPANRRHLLQVGAFATTVGATPSLGATEQDPHIEWMRQLQALFAYAEETFPDTEEGRQLYSTFVKKHTPPLKKLLFRTPAKTVAGTVSQLRLLADELDFFPEEREDDPYTMMLYNVIETLERLSGSQA